MNTSPNFHLLWIQPYRALATTWALNDEHKSFATYNIVLTYIIYPRMLTLRIKALITDLFFLLRVGPAQGVSEAFAGRKLQ